MMALAYRMLGSICEAEEIVQDAYIKWHDHAKENIHNPKSWLLKVCSNLALDRLKKSYKKREEYVGPWLPEPVVNKLGYWEEDHLEKSESLSMAFLLILENLNPMERVVYLLHDIFGYSFKEIGSIVDRSDSHCRKIAERARKYIQTNKPKFDTPSNQDFKILEKFFENVKNGKINRIKELFSENLEFWSDGGGKAIALPKVMVDPEKIGKFFIGILKQGFSKEVEFKNEFTTINNRPGLIFSSKTRKTDWKLETVFSFEFEEGKISRIFAVRNPDKLSLNKV